jgi:hypothetical protein
MIGLVNVAFWFQRRCFYENVNRTHRRPITSGLVNHLSCYTNSPESPSWGFSRGPGDLTVRWAGLLVMIGRFIIATYETVSPATYDRGSDQL